MTDPSKHDARKRYMRRFLLFTGLAAVVMLGSIGVMLLFPGWFLKEPIRQQLVMLLEHETGRKASIREVVSLERDGLVLADVRIHGASGAQEDLLVVEQVEVALSLFDLFMGGREIQLVRLVDGKLHLHREADGSTSVDDILAHRASLPPGEGARLDQLALRRLDVIWSLSDAPSKTWQLIGDIGPFELRQAASSEPATTAVEVTLGTAGQVSLGGQLHPSKPEHPLELTFTAHLDPGQLPLPSDLPLTFPPGQLQVEGTLTGGLSLETLQAQASVALSQLDVEGIPLEAVRLESRLDAGQLALDLRAGGLPGMDLKLGLETGWLKGDARHRFELAAENVGITTGYLRGLRYINPVLALPATSAGAQGTFHLRFKGEAAGTGLEELWSTVTGEGQVEFGTVVLRGSPLLGALDRYLSGGVGDRVRLEGYRQPFRVEQGWVRNPGTVIPGPADRFSIVMEGATSLKGDLDHELLLQIPLGRGLLGNRAIGVPIRVEGTVDAPVLRLPLFGPIR